MVNLVVTATEQLRIDVQSGKNVLTIAVAESGVVVSIVVKSPIGIQSSGS